MKTITVAIPVFNAFEDFERCLASVLRNSPDCEVLVIEDSSTDPRVRKLLGDHPEVKTVLHKRNRGFVFSANEAFASCKGDVILLNSDTQVPPNWIARLRDAAYSAPDVMASCPLSNSATIVSVPNNGPNELPEWLSVDEMDRIVEETSDRRTPEIPTAMGFCVYYRREALDKTGVFDPNFGRGYGEEVDHSLRARAKGYKVVVADSLFVWHKGEGSFGKTPEAIEERKQGRALVTERWPEYPNELAAWWDSAPLRAHKMRILDRLRPRAVSGPKRPRVLYVLHNWDGYGGLETYSRQLLEELHDRVEFTVCHPSPARADADAFVRWHVGVPRVSLNSRLLGSRLHIGMFPGECSNERSEHFFRELLMGTDPEIVHFQHLGGFGSLELPRIAKEHGCKVVLGLHDDFLICPLLRLGGACQKRECLPDDQCVGCIEGEERLQVFKQTTRDELLTLLEQRNYITRAMLDYCDVITVPSKCLADSMPDHLAQLRGMWTVGKLRIIPHGVNVNPVVAIRRPSDKLRVGWFGAGSAKKGFGTFCDVARALKDSGVEFSVHAPLDPEVNLEGLEHVTFHGPFEHGALGTWLQTVDVAVVAAMRNETYGSVVDEVVAYGCPVLVANVPAIAERYANNSTSPIFPYDWGDADKLGTWITTFAEHPERLPKREARALKSFEANALDYLKIYRELAP